MLVFNKWYLTNYGEEVDYSNDDLLNKVYKDYLDYRESYPLTSSFLDSWTFLLNHPIFKGQFQDCLDICPTLDDVLGECILLETCVYEENDGLCESLTDEFIRCYDCDIDVWCLTFEKGIQILAELVKERYGDYSEYESSLSSLELSFGKDGAKEQLEKLQSLFNFESN